MAEAGAPAQLALVVEVYGESYDITVNPDAPVSDVIAATLSAARIRRSDDQEWDLYAVPSADPDNSLRLDQAIADVLAFAPGVRFLLRPVNLGI